MPQRLHTPRLPWQTLPDVFTDRRRMAPGEGNEGIFHQWRLNYTLAGRCRNQTQTDYFMVGAGDMYLTRERIWMSLRVEGGGDGDNEVAWDTAYAVFHPRPHWRVWLDALDFKDGLARLSFQGEARSEIETALLNMVQAYQTAGMLRDEHALLALENVLLKIYASAVGRQMAPDQRVRQAVEFIHARYAEPLAGPDIAHAAGLSVPHLATLFAAVMRTTPGEYLERFRLARAAELLRFSVGNVSEIARATGYSDPNYFTRRFRLRYGETPRAYRHTGRPRDV